MIDSRKKLSRRTFLTGISIVAGAGSARKAMASYQLAPKLTSIGHGIEIRDFRIFPSPDVKRFIVEVHNTTDSPIDTPSLGVILPHLPAGEDFGVAVPASSVLHPHTSGALIGVSPKGLEDDANWGDPEWVLCSALETHRSETIAYLNLDVSYELDILSDTHAQVVIQITNLEDYGTGEFVLAGEVLDSAGRVCGILSPWTILVLKPKDHREVRSNISEEMGYLGSPFVMIDTVKDIKVQISLQPETVYKPIVCPSVMPWNR